MHDFSGRALIWRGLNDNLCFESFRLQRTKTGAGLHGTVLAVHDTLPLRVEYRIHCDTNWQTCEVHIEQTWSGIQRKVDLEHDGRGIWRVNGTPEQTLANCTHVDLSVSPSTNALPINRLTVKAGQTRHIRAAWISFPELIVSAVEQSYRRISTAGSQQRYQFVDLATNFMAEITVDEDGIPTLYEGLWERVAARTIDIDELS
jgi:uncharacterized protein